MIITFFASFEDSKEEVTINLDDGLKVKEMLPKILQGLDISESRYLEKYCFLYGIKNLNSTRFLEKTLKEAGLQANRSVKVWDISHLNPT